MLASIVAALGSRSFNCITFRNDAGCIRAGAHLNFPPNLNPTALTVSMMLWMTIHFRMTHSSAWLYYSVNTQHKAQKASLHLSLYITNNYNKWYYTWYIFTHFVKGFVCEWGLCMVYRIYTVYSRTAKYRYQALSAPCESSWCNLTKSWSLCCALHPD